MIKKAPFIVLLILFSIASFVRVPKTRAVDVEEGSQERLIVRFRTLTPRIYRERILNSLRLRDSNNLKLENTVLLRVSTDRRQKVIESLERNLLVDYVEPDFVAYATEVPNDPEFPNQWGLAKVDAAGAWNKTHGANDVDVAIIDTGIDGSHPDIGGKVVVSVDCKT